MASLTDDAPVFVDATPISASLLNILRDTALAVDEASRLGGAVFHGSFGHRVEYTSRTVTTIWRGAFVYLDGMTVLQATTLTTGTVRAGDTLRVTRGDTDSVYNDFSLSLGTQAHSVAISGAGYADGQIVRVRLILIHAADPPHAYDGCFVEPLLVEASPVALAGWSAPPTFSGAGDLTAAKLNALGASLTWLVRRIARRCDPLFMSAIRRKGPWYSPAKGRGETDVMWRGGLRRTSTHTTIKASGRVLVLYGATEAVTLYLNGVAVASYSVPTAAGDYAWTLTASLSGYSVGSVVSVVLWHTRTGAAIEQAPVNRWSIAEVSTLAPSGSPATLAAWAVRQAGVSPAALVAWLTTLRTIAADAYSRIAADDAVWEIQRCFAARPAHDEDQFRMFEPWGIALSWARTGEALLLRGRGLSIGYGSGWVGEEQNEVGAYEVLSAATAQATAGDAVESAVIYLDTIPAIPVGAAYNVRGAECYAAFERLRIVEDV